MENYYDSEYDTPEGKEKCENEMESIITCEKTVHQKAKVSLPLLIKPFVVAGKIKSKCCGNPKVSIDCKDNCSYVITQEICVEIPLKFGVFTAVKDEFVECESPDIEDDCND